MFIRGFIQIDFELFEAVSKARPQAHLRPGACQDLCQNKESIAQVYLLPDNLHFDVKALLAICHKMKAVSAVAQSTAPQSAALKNRSNKVENHCYKEKTHSNKVVVYLCRTGERSAVKRKFRVRISLLIFMPERAKILVTKLSVLLKLLLLHLV